MSDEGLPHLLSRMYTLNGESKSWEQVLDEIKKYLRGSAAAVVIHDFVRNQGCISYASGYNLEFLTLYDKYYARLNPWLIDEGDYQTIGAIHIGEDRVAEAELMKTEMYIRWLKPQNLHHRLCAVLERKGPTALFLEVMRPRAWRSFDADDVERARLLLPHLERSLSVCHRMAILEAERNAALHALDDVPWGVVLVDEHGSRLAANRCAREILAACDGLTVHGNTLRAELPDESARLDRLLKQSIRSNGDRNPLTDGAISITRSSGSHPLRVRVVPLHTKPDIFAERVPAAAIYISDLDLQLDSNELLLRDLYALTPVEARLAACLSQAKSVEEAATAMGVTVNTARAYLKRIYNKTGVRRQTELVRLLLLGLTRPLCRSEGARTDGLPESRRRK
jgi:DNA-binding CsgD family transcriptional regulator